MPKLVVATACSCCKRTIRADAPEGKCWECRGRPATAGYVLIPPGKRDPACPHEMPGGE